MLTNNFAPSITKYMGSKKKLLDFVIDGINEVYLGNDICDLFAGSCSLVGALNNQANLHVNDIQAYSSIFANTYLFKNKKINNDEVEQIKEQILKNIFLYENLNKNYSFNYSSSLNLDEFNLLEKQQQELINNDFLGDYHLFQKNYSGTYWSYEQCLRIDAIREIAELYSGKYPYYLILSSLIFAMAYTSQSTGHYAQYRDAHTNKSMNDILIYRRKNLETLFFRKFDELLKHSIKNEYEYYSYNVDYKECLKKIPDYTTVYADPPYCFVHYSRFYHAIETLVRYDYPEVKFKGRYREDRHQSPFCLKTKVKSAFSEMFKLIFSKNNSLVLSYSNTGMISLEEILELAHNIFNEKYSITTKELEYLHSTMGRKDDKHREVKELLILIKKL